MRSRYDGKVYWMMLLMTLCWVVVTVRFVAFYCAAELLVCMRVHDLCIVARELCSIYLGQFNSRTGVGFYVGWWFINVLMVL